MTRLSQQILTGAKRLAPRGDHRSGSGEPKKGPTLVASLHETKLVVTPAEVSRSVGSDNRYAATVHQGSRPHIIRGKGKMLKFRWGRGNLLLQRRGRGGRQFFFFRSVNHPGNKRSVQYLTTPLRQFGRAEGFITTATIFRSSPLP